MTELSYGTEPTIKIDTLAEATKRAAVDGLHVFIPGPRNITLDFDTNEDYLTYVNERLPFFKRFFEVVDSHVTASKSGGGRKHVFLTLNRGLSEPQRIAAQAILNSDWRRELYSLARNEKEPFDGESIRMFEKPGSVVGEVVGLRKVA